MIKRIVFLMFLIIGFLHVRHLKQVAVYDLYLYEMQTLHQDTDCNLQFKKEFEIAKNHMDEIKQSIVDGFYLEEEYVNVWRPYRVNVWRCTFNKKFRLEKSHSM